MKTFVVGAIALCSLLNANEEVAAVLKRDLKKQASSVCSSPNTCCYAPGYNGAFIKEICNPINLSFNGSFIYWKPAQEGMQTYTLYSAESTNPGLTSVLQNNVFQTGFIQFKYKPGFQVGFEIESPYDNWRIYSEYTWYHHQFSDFFNFPGPSTLLSGFEVSLLPLFLLDPSPIYLLLQPSTLNSLFDLHLNWIFLELARVYYVGDKLTLRTHFGLRGDRNTQTITQDFNLSQTSDEPTPANDRPVSGKVREWSHSWALGPRAGISADYLLPYDFKVFGNLALSLLYAKFCLKGNQNSILVTPFDTFTETVRLNPITQETASPNLEMGIGTGWGRSFCSNAFRLQLLVSYDLNALWNQNMFLELDRQSTGAGTVNSPQILFHDLFLQGLTVKASIDL
ncbi:MAG: hypothetical protein HY069_00225 [Chlamydiia bacterium]|nr:hypothetical protein [Chlamydiia bacterium]